MTLGPIVGGKKERISIIKIKSIKRNSSGLLIIVLSTNVFIYKAFSK